VSGGKDSWTLIRILDVLRARAKIDFSLQAVTIDSGYEGFQCDAIARACSERGWPHRVVHTSIGVVLGDVLDDDETPCALCGRLRRGVLYRVASEEGATKIALGHHADDCIETLLLNLLFEGTLKAMPARLTSDTGGHTVIRPLVYVFEADVSAYAKSCGLPIVGCRCRACGDFSLQRQRAKRLLLDLEASYPGVKRSMLRALRNVTASHLLDTRLNPPAARRCAEAGLMGAG
jgi:tRNA 2-thiocytidine biosynthesis protein TtcA